MMKSVDILEKLEKVNFTNEQSRAITEIFEDYKDVIASKEDVKIIVSSEVHKAKYDLVKWIVGGIIVNGALATLLKFLA